MRLLIMKADAVGREKGRSETRRKYGERWNDKELARSNSPLEFVFERYERKKSLKALKGRREESQLIGYFCKSMAFFLFLETLKARLLFLKVDYYFSL